jgi:hypothetical protein
MPDLNEIDLKRRRDEYERHVNALDGARLLDATAISRQRAAPKAPITRAAPQTVAAGSMADFIDKYRNLGSGTIDLGNTVLDFGNQQFAMDRASVSIDGGELRFNRPGGGQPVPEKNCYGIVLAAPNAGFGKRTKIRTNRGAIWTDNSGCGGFTFSADVVSGSDAKYYTPTIWSGVGAANWRIVGAHFHDSPGSDRVLEIWGWSGEYSDCRLHNVNDGGHVMDCGAFKFARNYATQLHRMMLEIQHPCRDAQIFLEDNTAFDWLKPWNDSFFLSVMAREAAACWIRRNYANNRFDGPWGKMDNGLPNRFGIGLECEWGGPPGARTPGGMVEDNVLGGPNKWFTLISAGERDIPARNNRMCGPTDIGYLSGEPGFWGSGSVKDMGGNQQLPASAMPAPPPAPDDPNPPPPPPTMKLTYKDVALQPNGGVKATISITDIPAGATSGALYSRASGDPNNPNLNNNPKVAPTPKAFSITGTSADVVLTDIHPGWAIDVKADVAPGGVSTGWVRVPSRDNLPGKSDTAWPPGVEPPPSDEYDLITTTTQHFKNGKPSGNPSVTSTAKPVA